MSSSSWPHGLQHARLPCPSLSPIVCSNSCPLVHPTISFCVAPLLPSVFPIIRVFSNGSALCLRWPMHWSFSINPSNEYSELISFRLTGLLLQSKVLFRVFSSTTVQKHHFFGAQPSLWSNSHMCTWLLGKTIALTRRAFVGKVMSLLFVFFF